MNAIRQRLTTNWHLTRIMRLGIGIMMLVAGIQGRDWAIGLFSTFFLFQAVTDTGCCGSGACYPATPRNKGNNIESFTEYEEIK